MVQNKNIIPDIDIDFPDAKKVFECIPNIRASLINHEKNIEEHNSGIYLNKLPTIGNTNISSIPYKEAENLGFFKIDFLSLSVYKKIKDEEHLYFLMNKEPEWEILENEILVDELFQLKNNFSVVSKIKPKNIQDLAIVIALLRPAKKYLLNHDIEFIRDNIWKPEENGFMFKKSHSISYAMVIILEMNLLMEG